MSALDPQAKAVIDLVIKSGRPPYHQLSPKDARQMFRDTRPASTPPAPGIAAVSDLTADGPGHGGLRSTARRGGRVYAEAPREGVRVDTICYGGMIHGFVPMGRLNRTANRAVAHIAASLRQTLQPGWEAMKGVAP